MEGISAAEVVMKVEISFLLTFTLGVHCGGGI